MSISSSSVVPTMSSGTAATSTTDVGSKGKEKEKEENSGHNGIEIQSTKKDPIPLPPRTEVAERDRSASPTSVSKASDVLKEVVARDSEERARRGSLDREGEKENVAQVH